MQLNPQLAWLLSSVWPQHVWISHKTKHHAVSWPRVKYPCVPPYCLPQRWPGEGGRGVGGQQHLKRGSMVTKAQDTQDIGAWNSLKAKWGGKNNFQHGRENCYQNLVSLSGAGTPPSLWCTVYTYICSQLLRNPTNLVFFITEKLLWSNYLFFTHAKNWISTLPHWSSYVTHTVAMWSSAERESRSKTQ